MTDNSSKITAMAGSYYRLWKENSQLDEQIAELNAQIANYYDWATEAESKLAAAQQTISAQAGEIAELKRHGQLIGERLQEYDQDRLEVAYDYIDVTKEALAELAGAYLDLMAELKQSWTELAVTDTEVAQFETDGNCPN